MIQSLFSPIGIGSFPHKEAYLPTKLVLDVCSNIPFWVQLPNRSWLENMLFQHIGQMPGKRINQEKKEIYFSQVEDAEDEIEEFYINFLKKNIEYFKLTPEFSTGFFTFLDEVQKIKRPSLLKGQTCGPITLGVGLKVENNLPLIYDENYKDILVKYIGMHAKWQEEKFKETIEYINTIIFFDEPILSNYGTPGMNLQKSEIIEILNECISYISGLSGIHICGATDWSIIMETNINIIHFDAYSYLQNFLAYSKEINIFLKRGGIIAWGIVPSAIQQDKIEEETVHSLVKKFEEAINTLSKEGIDKDIILQNSLISQSCGLGTLTESQSEKVMLLTKELTKKLQQKYGYKDG